MFIELVNDTFCIFGNYFTSMHKFDLKRLQAINQAIHQKKSASDIYYD